MDSILSERIKNWLLIGAIGCIPLIQSTALADPTLLPRQIWVSLVLMGMLIMLALNKSSQKFQFPLVAFSGLILWWISTGFSLSVATVIQEGYYSFSKLSWFVVAVIVFYQVFSYGQLQPDKVSYGPWIAAVIGLLLLIAEVIDHNLITGDRNQLYEIRTAFGHKNLYASFQFLCIPFIAAIFLRTKNLQKWLAGLTMAMVVASILYVQTRAVWIGLTVTAITGLLLYAGSFVSSKQQRGIYIFLFSMALLGILTGGYYFKGNITEKVLNADSLRERILLWENTLLMIKEHIWLGAGAGNWQILFPKYGLGNFMQTNYLISDGYTTFQRPHNDFLWVWSEAGIMGILGFLVFLLFPNIKGIFTYAKNQQQKALLLPVACITGYLFVAFMDFPLERNEHQFILAILIAWLLYLTPYQSMLRINRKPLMMIIACLVLFSLFVAWKRYPNETHAKKMIEAHRQGNWDKLLMEGKKIEPAWYAVDNFSIPVSWYEGVALFSEGNTPDAAIKFEKAYQINPWQVHVLNNMASIHELQGNHIESLKYYDALLAISPAQPDALLNKSAVLYNIGRNEDAFRCIYRFKYDDHNEQFLTYLHAIGKTLILEKQSAGVLKTSYTADQLDENPDLIRKILRLNQQKKATFEEINFAIHE